MSDLNSGTARPLDLSAWAALHVYIWIVIVVIPSTHAQATVYAAHTQIVDSHTSSNPWQVWWIVHRGIEKERMIERWHWGWLLLCCTCLRLRKSQERVCSGFSVLYACNPIGDTIQTADAQHPNAP